MDKELEDKEFIEQCRNELNNAIDSVVKQPRDFNGKKIKLYMEFECCDQLTVGELKKRLLDYPDDAIVYMEASNTYNRGDTFWSQKALDTYPCVDHDTNGKALMIVGDIR